MAIVAQIPWNDGNGNIIIESIEGKPNIYSISSSTANDDIEREQILTFKAINSSGIAAEAKLKVRQLGYRELFITSDDKIFTTVDNVNLKVKK